MDSRNSASVAVSDTGQPATRYRLRLYVTGRTGPCIKAFEYLTSLCDAYLKGRCQIEVVDVWNDPEKTAIGLSVSSVPTVVRVAPLPIRRFSGDFSDTEAILAALGLD